MSVSPDMDEVGKPGDVYGQRMFRADHGIWIGAVKSNDVETVRRMLGEADKDEKNILLEGWVDTDVFWTAIEESVVAKEAFAIRRVYALAAICGALEVLEELFKQGIDVSQTDTLGNNAIHALIIYSSRHSGFEEFHVKVYQHLTSILPSDVMKKLIHAINTDDLRPVELAAHLQTFRLMEAIYNTPVHYVQRRHNCGIMSIIHYQIEEYEGLEAIRPLHKSPMVLLVHLGNSKLADEYTRKIFTKGVFADWICCRRKSFAWLVIIWLLIRLFVIAIAFLATGLTAPIPAVSRLCGYDSGLSDEAQMAFTLLLLIFAIAGLGYDVWDLVNITKIFPQYRKRYAVDQGPRVVRYGNYRLSQTLFNVSATILCLNKICDHFEAVSMSAYWTEIFIVIFTICSIWSLLFFGQLTETLGNYITATQRMINSLFKFGALIMTFILPFMFTFSNFVLRDENGTCPAEFSSVASCLYSGFEISQNMQDLRSYSSPSVEGLWLAHVAYVILVVILLLNFLISIFSDSYTDVAANPDIIFALQWLSVLATIESRVPCCMQPLLYRMKRRHFPLEASTSNILIKTFET